MESPLKTEVLVTGTFNVLHAGHIRLLEFASKHGLVTVGINNDSYLKGKYGDKAVSLEDRIYVLTSNKYVSNVVVFDEDEPSNLILELKPTFYVKGPDYKDVVLPEAEAVERAGCKLIIHPALKEYNSSNLIHSLPINVFRKVRE